MSILSDPPVYHGEEGGKLTGKLPDYKRTCKMSEMSRYDEMPTIVGVYRQNRRLAFLSFYIYRLRKVDFPLS